MEVLEEGFTRARCYLMGIRQVLVTKEDVRQGRGDGEALSEPPAGMQVRAKEASGGLTVVGTQRLGFMGRHFGKRTSGTGNGEDGSRRN